ncbi:HD domain-containing protein, partial [Mesorhizobium sp. M1D.F.Ca.ET.234.01.1.1]|uniref:HD domain-containing protein n=1 Tax=Mesorhizobium sp. M1D.F.Ca.ET.234.01.1.1 TaxID=2563932 RepID=UPI001FDEDA3F
RAEIDELFGPEMGKLVEGLTKLKKLDLVSKKAEQAENLRKLLLAISEDVRVLLVTFRQGRGHRLDRRRSGHDAAPRQGADDPRGARAARASYALS